jgi:hypothetical protein
MLLLFKMGWGGVVFDGTKQLNEALVAVLTLPCRVTAASLESVYLDKMFEKCFQGIAGVDERRKFEKF